MQGQTAAQLEGCREGGDGHVRLLGNLLERIVRIGCFADAVGDFADDSGGCARRSSRRLDEGKQEIERRGTHLHTAGGGLGADRVVGLKHPIKCRPHRGNGRKEAFGHMGERTGQPFAPAHVEPEKARRLCGNPEEHRVDLQSRGAASEVMRLRRRGNENVPRHEWIFSPVDGVEDKVSLEAKAEFHATGMIVEVDRVPDVWKAAATQERNAGDPVRSDVKSPVAGSVVVVDSVRNHCGAHFITTGIL